MRCDEIRDGDVVVRRPSSSVVVRRRLSLINQSINPSVVVVVVVVVVHVARRTSTSRTRLKAPARDGDIFPRSRARSIVFLCTPSMKKWSVFPYGYLVYAFTRTIRVATRSNTGDFRSNKGRARSNQTTLPVPPLSLPPGTIWWDRF